MNHFLQSEYAPVAPDAAGFHIIPVPFERSVSYGCGTERGPESIIAASQQLEAFDGVGFPGALGMHTTAAVETSGSTEHVMDAISCRVKRALDACALPVMLGGEHTVSFGAIRTAHQYLGQIGIVQIDAHADLRDQYEGSKWSHACVMRRVSEMGIPILQIGVRSLCAEELKARKSFNVTCLDAQDIHRGVALSDVMPADFPKQVYVTFDVDGLDASLMPATGTPEPGGLTFWQALDLVAEATRDRDVVGLDVVELAPQAGLHHADYTAAKLAYCLMGLARPASASASS